ncbi:molecular chaperone DnaJ [Flavobacterium cheongpyeongense]|uniref:Molecular chaperone DnaJ n=1 Tax=Flavobacterium cheongpyeongense TaxID=2212651 RepID=A0A2V4BN41_9FLAO|nr:J domain-containing protein [Flavobacterium cheongpyeongense]PXY40425.1 molecular chaperone DnaJ [Flavobacterium cheongpyeongense]
MEFIDYYKVLEIPKTASKAEIKKAYRKLARKYHPDLNPNDRQAEKKFKEINEANEVLGNEENRKKYDTYGKNWKQAQEFEKSGYNPNDRQSSARQYQDGNSEENFSQFFQSMYGSGNSQRRSTSKFKGEDLNAQFQLTLKEAFSTHKQIITVNHKNIRITIPAGVENGQTIKIPGHGSSGINAGPNGDLFLTFSITDNADFKREGNNLYSNTELDVFTAVLGGEITINTFDTKVKLNVPAGTQTGTRVKLKGKGFPVYKNEDHFGDLYITYILKTPVNLTEKQKELFVELSELSTSE